MATQDLVQLYSIIGQLYLEGLAKDQALMQMQAEVQKLREEAQAANAKPSEPED